MNTSEVSSCIQSKKGYCGPTRSPPIPNYPGNFRSLSPDWWREEIIQGLLIKRGGCNPCLVGAFHALDRGGNRFLPSRENLDPARSGSLYHTPGRSVLRNRGCSIPMAGCNLRPCWPFSGRGDLARAQAEGRLRVKALAKNGPLNFDGREVKKRWLPTSLWRCTETPAQTLKKTYSEGSIK